MNQDAAARTFAQAEYERGRRDGVKMVQALVADCARRILNAPTHEEANDGLKDLIDVMRWNEVR